MSDNVPVYKVVLLGDAAVGKTSLVRRYIDDEFRDIRIETIGIDFQSKTVQVGERNEDACLLIWDVAGQDRFKDFRDQYYTGALAAALVYDVSDPASFFSLMSWHKEVRRHISGVPMIVIGNKAEDRHVVPDEEARGWANQIESPFLLVSAKTGENVAELFSYLAASAHDHLNELESFSLW